MTDVIAKPEGCPISCEGLDLLSHEGGGGSNHSQTATIHDKENEIHRFMAMEVWTVALQQ